MESIKKIWTTITLLNGMEIETASHVTTAHGELRFQSKDLYQIRIPITSVLFISSKEI
jgi:hypothetical protein